MLSTNSKTLETFACHRAPKRRIVKEKRKGGEQEIAAYE
jgi:hypothetical protein